MSEPNEADRQRAQALWETPYGNKRREGNVPYSFDEAFAAHRLAARREAFAEVVAYIEGYAKALEEMDGKPLGWLAQAMTARSLAERINQLKGSST